jgi:hypothetical protein
MEVIAGRAAIVVDQTNERYQPASLPRNERRRATNSTRLAFRLCEQVQNHASSNMADIPTVFASSGGDYDVIHKICSALSLDEKFISPTDFHNSVHNAPAGYWSIASQSHAPSTSFSAGDATFPMALVEASLLCNAEQCSTLLVAYDIPPPQPLRTKRPIEEPFGIALLLGPESKAGESKVVLDIVLGAAVSIDSQPHPRVANVALSNPIARCLPLMGAIADEHDAEIQFAGTPGVKVKVTHG